MTRMPIKAFVVALLALAAVASAQEKLNIWLVVFLTLIFVPLLDAAT